MSNQKSQRPKRTVVILSGFLREGVADKITSLDYEYKRKELISSKENWLSIIELLQNLRQKDILAAVFIYLTEETLFRTSQTEYEHVWSSLLYEIKQTRNLAFIYEDNILGIFTRINEKKLNLASYQTGEFWRQNDFYGFFDEETKEKVAKEQINTLTKEINALEEITNRVKRLIGKIYEHNIDVVPYKRNLEVTLRIQDYLDEIDGGIFLRLYVPNGRFQADQFANILQLFEKYLRDVEGKTVLIENRKTNHGTLYVFKDKSRSLAAPDVDAAITRFQDFMDLSQSDASRAEQIIVDMGAKKSEAIELISRFATEYQRIKLQIRQEGERALLALRHRFENELLNISDKAIIPDQQALLAPSVISLANNYGPITVNVSNITSQEASIVQSTAESIFNGDVTYSNDDRILIDLFDRYADKITSLHLKAELAQLKDESTTDSTKKTAIQKILGFLYKIMPSIGEGAVKGLAAYLEKKIAGP